MFMYDDQQLSCNEQPTDAAAKSKWSVYLLLCKGNVIYTGITNDVARRYVQHCAGKGAKFTRSRPPLRLLCHTVAGDRSAALKLEYAIKQMPRNSKVSFVEAFRMGASHVVC